MKKTKMEKGITLVALVITVVVLLILAGVAISTINETGIIAKSNNAAHKFNVKQEVENGILNGYESLINQYGGSGTTATSIISAGTYKGKDTIDLDTFVPQQFTFVCINYDNNQSITCSGMSISNPEGAFHTDLNFTGCGIVYTTENQIRVARQYLDCNRIRCGGIT